MNRFTAVFCMVALIASGFAVAYGQDAAQKKNVAAGVNLTVSGEADIDYVYRDSVAQEAATWTGGGVADPNSAARESDTFFSAKITVRIEADLPDKAKFVLELENKRTNGEWVAGDEDGDGILEPGERVWESGNMDAGADTLDVFFEQAYLQLSEIYSDKLSVKLGVQDVKYELRGNGHAMFLDITEAESSFGAANGLSTTDRDTLEPVGFSFHYKEGVVNVDFFGMTVAEGGASSVDESIVGAYFRWMLDSVGPNSHVDVVAALNSGSDKNMEVWTLGGGANLMDIGAPGLDLFAEVYFQFGDAGRAGTEDLDAGGLAYELGGKYSFSKVEMKPWVELSYWFVSGDDDDADDQDDRFIGYEDVDQFLILEDNDYGIDVDTNYSAIKFSGGLSPRDDIELSAGLGFFKFDEDAMLGDEDDLGTELDVKVVYTYNANVKFDLTVASLFGADALEGITAEEDDKIQMFVMGTTVRF